MRIAEIIAKIANKILMICMICFAFVLMLLSLYVLYDIFYTNRNAFTSYDLLQYRPELTDTEENAQSFAELQRINPDTVGWLEIFDTNICYPIVQGKDDLEYAGKDIYGYSSLTGSIYLASGNSRDFNDWYNLIYGHHMDNGAMFGDIDKYRDEDYFYSHQKGVLQTPDGNFDLTVVACVITNSYENIIYSVMSKDEAEYAALHDFIINNSILYDPEHDSTELNENAKLFAFSTCEGASTNGRIVLLVDAEPLTGEIQRPEKEEEKPPVLTALGHISDEQHWAFLNLVCVLLTVLILFPVLQLRTKYRQLRYSKQKIRELKDSVESPAVQICRNLRSFIRKMRVGFLLELLLAAAAIVIFLLTENITKSVVIRDKWTGLMILIAYLALLADYICFRYRGKRPENAAE